MSFELTWAIAIIYGMLMEDVFDTFAKELKFV